MKRIYKTLAQAAQAGYNKLKRATEQAIPYTYYYNMMGTPDTHR